MPLTPLRSPPLGVAAAAAEPSHWFPPSGDTEGAGEKSWTRLVLREPVPPPAERPPLLLRSLDGRAERAADRELTGVLAGVAGPWVRVWLLWSLKKFNRNDTNSCRCTCSSGSHGGWSFELCRDKNDS